MNIYGTLNAKDYTVEDFYASAPISWTLQSGSSGILLSASIDLVGAVTVNRANSGSTTTFINPDTGIYNNLLHSSVKHLFYDRSHFFSGSRLVTSSLAGLQKNVFVVSVGQNFYGNRIKPTSFSITVGSNPTEIADDGYGNLFVSQSGIGTYVGNIFYDRGIAVITEATGAALSSITPNGLKLNNAAFMYLDYSSEIKVSRHQANVRIKPSEYNFSPFNPSITGLYGASGSISASFVTNNIPSASAKNTWYRYTLMANDIIKPYITSIGLYNDKYELLAVAKISTPIQRTFNTNQIFIVRFDA